MTEHDQSAHGRRSSPLTMAIPKGRLLSSTTALLNRAGYDIQFDDDRSLIYDDVDNGLRMMLVKNKDLPIYLSRGIAGLGVCGSDILFESELECFRLMRFDFGGVKMCLAGLKNADATAASPLTIATKFPRFTRNYFHNRGVAVRVVELSGSVELAPLLGLADLIVDIVETGETLRANGLEMKLELATIDIYLVANPALYKYNYRAVDDMVRRLGGH